MNDVHFKITTERIDLFIFIPKIKNNKSYLTQGTELLLFIDT